MRYKPFIYPGRCHNIVRLKYKIHLNVYYYTNPLLCINQGIVKFSDKNQNIISKTIILSDRKTKTIAALSMQYHEPTIFTKQLMGY